MPSVDLSAFRWDYVELLGLSGKTCVYSSVVIMSTTTSTDATATVRVHVGRGPGPSVVPVTGHMFSRGFRAPIALSIREVHTEP